MDFEDICFKVVGFSLSLFLLSLSLWASVHILKDLFT